MDGGVQIIGAGIVGLATAMQLLQDGRHVRLIDRLPPGEGTSYGNAGIIATASVAPVGAPGLWRRVPGMLADPLGPLTIRWSYLPVIAPWLLKMLRYSSKKEFHRLAGHISALSRDSFRYFEPILEAAGAQKLTNMSGCLYVYETESGFSNARDADFALRRQHGVPAELLSAEEIRQFLPALQVPVAGGMLCPEAGFVIDPLQLSQQFAETLQQNGAEIVQAEVTGFDVADRHIRAVQTARGDFTGEGVVIAAGAYSKTLTRMLGHRPPLDTERGYHVMLPHANTGQNMTALIPELGFGVTPMARGLRLAGTVEFAGTQAPPNWQRAERLLHHGRRLFADLDTQDSERWMGYRPSMPDSLPVISRLQPYDNGFAAFGHGHLGLTQAAVTGRMIADMIAGRPPAVDPTPYRIDRF